MVPSDEKDTRRDNRGRWLPPKQPGSNRPFFPPGQARPEGLTYYHNGATSTLLNEWQENVSDGRRTPFKTFSLYTANGVIWAVNYDATKHWIGDGKHENVDLDESSDMDARDDDRSNDEDKYDDWSELSFTAAIVDRYSSVSTRVGLHLPQRRLLTQRRDQVWVQHLIPDRYRSRLERRDPDSGGLAGDLPLLIALVAMSLPISRWTDLLPQTMTNKPGWEVTQGQIDEVEYGSQCIYAYHASSIWALLTST